MCNKLAFLVCVIVVLGLVGSASAVEYDWEGPGTDWCDAGNWSPGGGPPGVPFSNTWPPEDQAGNGDTPPQQGPVIGAGCDVNVASISLPSGEVGQVMDITGGTLYVHGDWRWANDEDETGTVNMTAGDVNVMGNFRWGDNSGVYGIVNISGGTFACNTLLIGDDGSGEISISGSASVNCRNDLNLSCREEGETATLNMDGGTLIVAGTLGVPSEGGGDDYACTVNLDAGIIECGGFTHSDEPYSMDINDAILKIKGDHMVEMVNDIDLGYITGYNGTVTPSAMYDGEYTWVGFGLIQEKAWDPDPPTNTGGYCPNSVTISWTPGAYCVDDHNVYFGTSWDDVNESTTADWQHYASNSITLTDLEVGRTYFWRVDEVNDTDGNSPWKGSVWQFGTEGGVASDPSPDRRGLKAEDVDLLSWSSHCIADTHNLYFATDLPASIVLFEDDFEDGFDPGWAATTGWSIYNATGDSNFAPHDHNLAEAVAGTITSGDIDASDANSINVSFVIRLPKSPFTGAVTLNYYNGSTYVPVADWNSLDPNNTWIGYGDTTTDSQFTDISNFRIQLVSTLTGPNSVYIDDVTITNTWPTSAQWYEALVAGTEYVLPEALSPMTVYRWRVDTVIDGNVYQGPHWKFSTGYGGLLMYYRFDGTNPFPSPIQDDSDNDIEFYKYTDGGGSVTYGESNPDTIASTASAEFEPNAGLYRDDPCGPSEDTRDILRLDGDYTVEMWVKPRNLTDEENVYLISKRGSWGVEIHTDNDWEFRWQGGGGDTGGDSVEQVNDKWYHVAVVYDQNDEDLSGMYLNGDRKGDAGGLLPPDNNSPIWIGCQVLADGNLGNFFDGLIDEIRIHDIALLPCEFLLGVGDPEYPICPTPEDFEGEVDPCTVVLMWMPGESATSHKVYFSTDFADANTLDPSALEYEGPNTSVALPELDIGTTHYWRVVEQPGGQTGSVWRFTTEYVVEDANLILHYKFDEASGDDAIDASGHGYHGDLEGEENWEPAGGKFDGCLLFDDDTSVEPPNTVTTHLTNQVSISVWLNGLVDQDEDEDMVVLDVSTDSDANYAMRVVVPDEYGHVVWRAGNDSCDVLLWVTATPDAWEGDWHHFVFIKDESTGTMKIYFDTELVKEKAGAISSLSNIVGDPFEIGDDDYEGRMDDLRIYKKAISKSKVEELFRGGEVAIAWGPSPYDGQVNVSFTTDLTWKPGAYVADTNGHEVYFGTNYDEVFGANTTVHSNVEYSHQDACSYDPCGLLLDLGQTYYWRVDEVNDACDPNGWRGRVWQFTTLGYITIDDFEDDTAQDPPSDDWDKKQTGAVITLWSTPPKIIGKNSMKYVYNNDLYVGYYYSEIESRSLEPTDWTMFDHKLKLLSLWFYGDPGNAATETEQMYVYLKDNDDPNHEFQVKYGDADWEDMNDVKIADWREWLIPLSHFSTNDVNLANLDNLCIGFGIRGHDVPAGFGYVYFDNIRLYPAVCAPWGVFEGDLNGDCVVDFEDVEIMADAWLDSDCNCIEEYGSMPSPPGEPNLVARYEFEDGSGDTATDSTNNDYDGTISVIDVNVFWFTGHEGYALDFDGGWVSVPNGVTLLNLTDAVTVSCWIDRAQTDDGKIVVKGRNDWETYALEVNENRGRFFVRDTNDRENQYSIDSSDELPVNSWIHVAGTYDGNELTLYVNGRVAANSVHPLWGNLVADANDGLVIAGRWGDTDGGFIGTIDDVRIYDYALSGGEICYIASDGDGVAEMVNLANVFTNESKQSVNLKDFVELANNWLKRQLWPL